MRANRTWVAGLTGTRMAVSLSQGVPSDLLHRHQQFVSRYETGERRLDVVAFIDISRALGVDPVAAFSVVPKL